MGVLVVRACCGRVFVFIIVFFNGDLVAFALQLLFLGSVGLGVNGNVGGFPERVLVVWVEEGPELVREEMECCS